MKSQRHAFTLVELLVVIAIIGILIGMVMPAVQAARESARRAQCSNNLAQLSVAIQNYESAHQVYPSGTINGKGPIVNVPDGFHHNWIMAILPFIEERNTFKHLDQAASSYDAKNAPVRELTITVLQCPSEPYRPEKEGQSSYAGSHHDVEAPIDANNNGVFFLNSHIRYDDLEDGSSQTIFLGEKKQEPFDLGWMSGTRATLRNTGTTLNETLVFGPTFTPGKPKEDTDAATSGENEDAEPAASKAASAEGDATAAATGDAGEGKAAETSSPIDDNGERPSEEPESPVAAEEPVAPAPDSEKPARPVWNYPKNSPAPGPLYVGGFGCPHVSMVHFAFGDGSVKKLSTSIDQKVLQQLSNRADGKLLNAIDR